MLQVQLSTENMPIKNIAGQTFGLLTAVKQIDRPLGVKNGTYWECYCACSSTHKATLNNLQSGKVDSCGCLSKQKWKIAATTHGLSRHPINKVWEGMIDRCKNPANKRYANYGGRGITVCDKWQTLEGFAEDMLVSYEEGLTLDRIDNNQCYTKENCRWTNAKVQANNKTSNVKYEYKGSLKTIAEIIEEENLQLSYSTIWARIHQSGWGLIEAITTPLRY